MKRIAFLCLVIIFSALESKVPFNTLYLEIEKVRYEGDESLIKDVKNNSDILEQFRSVQKIWVNVLENSYLMIEEPDKDNYLIEKYGQLKYEGRHYKLDFGLNFAWDVTDTESERIYDNYTTEEPNYQYYNAKLVKKVMMRCLDGVKRRAHIYAYMYLDPIDEEQIQAYIDEIQSSDMEPADKEMEIKAAQEALEKKAIKYLEWIWVNEKGEELNMFLRKHETMQTVKIEYNVRKMVIDEDFDNDIFPETLSEFKVKKIKPY
ncbi:MAG: hypothetical protein R6V47_06515 [Candidatus Delongbacteria bacterium]